MEVLHDEPAHRFYLQLTDGSEAFLLYRRQADALDLYRTYVPPSSRERGLAEKLVETGFRYAQAQHLKVIPTCSYVSETFLKKHPEFLLLVKSTTPA